jgi:hypothetical protein
MQMIFLFRKKKKLQLDAWPHVRTFHEIKLCSYFNFCCHYKADNFNSITLRYRNYKLSFTDLLRKKFQIIVSPKCQIWRPDGTNTYLYVQTM